MDKETRKSTALFVQDLWEVSDEMILTTGYRFDRLSDFDDESNYRIALTS